MSISKKIAFVHDRLYYIAWAERVFFDIIRDTISQDTNKSVEYKIFTMFSDKKQLYIQGQHIDIIPALPGRLFAVFVFFDKHKIRGLSKLLDYRNLMFWYPILIRILQRKIKQYQAHDIVISSFAVAKNIANTDGNIPTTLYAQSPFMYIHNHYLSNLRKLRAPIRQIYQFARSYLLPRDLKPRAYHHIYTNSHYTGKLIQEIYGFTSTTQYPKLDPVFFDYPSYDTRSDYFIFVGRLVTFSKSVDIIIQAFNRTGHRLKIIGAGPDEQYLRSIAKDNIEFLWRIQDPRERCEIIWKAKGLVNITLESFGYVTAESLCLGTPVIWYNQWATPELVQDKNNGILIDAQTIDALVWAIQNFTTYSRDHKTIARNAKHTFDKSDLCFEIR